MHGPDSLRNPAIGAWLGRHAAIRLPPPAMTRLGRTPPALAGDLVFHGVQLVGELAAELRANEHQARDGPLVTEDDAEFDDKADRGVTNNGPASGMRSYSPPGFHAGAKRTNKKVFLDKAGHVALRLVW